MADAPAQHIGEVEEDCDCDCEWQRVGFPSEAEARAFGQGLEYGDEPQYEVDEIAPCIYEDGKWDVVFRYRED